MSALKECYPVFGTIEIPNLICFVYNTDVDECKRGTNNCSQLCINTVGSYTCDCILGFQLDSDGRACNSKPMHLM